MEKLWTAEQLADHLQVSVETVWRYTREGKLPAVKLGNHYRYSIEEAVAALRQGRDPAAGPSEEIRAVDARTANVTGRRMTYSEFSRLPEQPGLQLIDGFVVREPSPRYGHQEIVGRLYARLLGYVDERQLGAVIVAPFDVVLADDQVLQPDILFVAEERRSLIKETGVFGAPDLVVEVLSPATRSYDEGRKRELYLEHGCREMWLIDPDDLTAIFAVRVDNRWHDRRLARDDVLISPTLDGFRFRLGALPSK